MSSTSSHSSFSSDSSSEEDGEFRPVDLSLLIPSYRRLFRDLERDLQNNVSRRALLELVDKINIVYNAIHFLIERAQGTQNLSEVNQTAFNEIEHPSRAQELLAMRENRAVGALLPITISEGHVDAGLSCPICMDNFQLGSEVCNMPCHECHLFHSDCIKSWLEEHSTCPTCRTEVESRNLPERRNPSSESSERQDERNSRSPPPENSNQRSRSRSP